MNMNENYLNELEQLLARNKDYLVEEKLNKNKIAELAHKYDPELVDLLAGNTGMRRLFFVETASKALIFNKDKFIQFISNKEFLPDSYTSYKNKIGLGTGTNLLSENKEVVLNWPYKDCILEGGQDKEDAKRDEVFFNEVLAPDQIDRLLGEKVLTDWKYYDKDGVHDVTKFSDRDNLVIRGNNLLALHSLKRRYGGKVKLIYIDPPYNTGNDGFNYNDHFNHSTWLTFMKNRLEVAKELLSGDGSIFVQLDNNEVHYAKVLMDEVFGRKNFQREVIWRLDGLAGYKSLINNFVRGHESILFYSKTQDFKFNKQYLPYDEKQIKRFSSTDENGRKYKTISGDRRHYLDEAKGIPISDVWSDIASFQTVVNSPEIVKDFIGQKPEKLIERIISSVTDEGDLVLDYQLGTGTTAAVAHKMKRQYIGIEQLDYAEKDPINRLKDVIKGDNSGISSSIGWVGGGSFIHTNLMDLGNKFIDKVKKASSDKELENLLDQAKKSSFLSYKVDPEKINPGDKDFRDLSTTHKKQLLLELVDQNHLYVNYSEIDDADYNVSSEDKKLNKQFYEK